MTHVSGPDATAHLATIAACQRHTTSGDEASDGPGERVVTGDLDEHRAQLEDNRRWRAWP